MAAPNRGIDSDAYFTHALQEAEKTLQQIRVEHERDLMQLKISNANALTKASKDDLKELEKLELDLAKKVNTFQNELRKKLVEKYSDDAEGNAELEKQLAKEVMEYIATEKRKASIAEMSEEHRKHEERLSLILEEHKTELTNIRDLQKANKRALQDKKKNHKEYVKDRKKLLEEEVKLKKQTAEKLRKSGATDLEILKETGIASGDAIKEAVFSKETMSAIANNLINGIKATFDNTIQTYGTYQQKINTRLQGSTKMWNTNMLGLSGIEQNIKYAVGSNPYVKLQTIMDNVVKATEAGIATNIEQRAFLNTVKDSIATTFDAFDSSLTRIIRLQQADTTAARLGLEAGLTSFFNSYFEDSSYLNSAFDAVSQNLVEATSQMSGESGVAFEYIVQKWLGSLYSLGFSDSAVGKIASALGQLGSGNVSGLASDTAMQNLLVMSAARGNLSYADLLEKGLDASNVNTLLKAMVGYLSEIAKSDNKVVKSEYAKIFGMTVSDLKAVTNLEGDLESIAKSVMSYQGAMNELYDQMGQITSRVSVAGQLQNMLANVNYSMGSSIASNPATFALWEITSMIEDLTGGINLPTISTLGNMVDLNTTVTNLMRAGIVGVSTLGAIGPIISGIGSTFSPSSMLSALGIENGSNAPMTVRGQGLNRKLKQLKQQSKSGLTGNSAAGDYYEETLTSANYEKDKLIEQQTQNSIDVSLNDIHEYLLSVFDPKITEIEKLLALLAGYNTSVTSWGEFKNGENTVYKGSTVQVHYVDDIKITQDNNDLLKSIKENTLNIYNLLQKVVSGESSLTVRTEAALFNNSVPGFNT